jgi:hypothetical protein
MVSSVELVNITADAHALGDNLYKDFIAPENLLMGPYHQDLQGIASSSNVKAVFRFAELHGYRLQVVSENAMPDGLFSMLDPLVGGQKGTISLCLNRMVSAFEMSHAGGAVMSGGLGSCVQTIRSILHEIGHSRLNIPNKSNHELLGGFVATPHEDNIAWVFALMLLSMGAGDASEFGRQNGDRDEVVFCPI